MAAGAALAVASELMRKPAQARGQICRTAFANLQLFKGIVVEHESLRLAITVPGAAQQRLREIAADVEIRRPSAVRIVHRAAAPRLVALHC